MMKIKTKTSRDSAMKIFFSRLLCAVIYFGLICAGFWLFNLFESQGISAVNTPKIFMSSADESSIIVIGFSIVMIIAGIIGILASCFGFHDSCFKKR